MLMEGGQKDTPKNEGQPPPPPGGRMGPPSPGGPMEPPPGGGLGGWISTVPPFPTITDPCTKVVDPFESNSGKSVTMTVGVWIVLYLVITTSSYVTVVLASLRVIEPTGPNPGPSPPAVPEEPL